MCATLFDDAFFCTRPGLEAVIEIVYVIALEETHDEMARAGFNLLEALGRFDGLQTKILEGWVTSFETLVRRAVIDGDVVAAVDPSQVVGTGGPARAFARVRTVDALGAALAWARERDLPSVTVGLGSNVLAADTGVEALVLRLEGELAEVDVVGERLLAGGGAANAVCLHRARAAGLGGLEFACAIPGTAGGGVRMNAGAYGSDWAAILERRSSSPPTAPAG